MVGTSLKRSRSASVAKASGLTALHRSRLFEWRPSPVNIMSACPAAPLVAIGYESGDLELWDLNAMVCVQRITGEGIEVTSLAWALDGIDNSWRTFAGYLDGSLVEIYWTQCCVGAATDSSGGAIWALASQPAAAIKPGYPHRIAAACDDGGIRIFGVEGAEPGAQFERMLMRLQGRALACAWHPSVDTLVAGGVNGSAHVLDATSGREQLVITVSSTTASPACIWQLLVLADGTIVSGDSEGATQFWDGRFGTLLQRFQQHSADVLALAALPDGTAVFSAGVDSQVAMFSPVQGQERWAYLHYKRPHTHDVRALAMVVLPQSKAVLLSGGLDAQLIAYPAAAFLQEHPVRLSKAPQRPICQLALQLPPPPSTAASSSQHRVAPEPQAPRLLCAQHDVCDVWQLGRSATDASPSGRPHAHEGERIELLAGPRHLARIKYSNGCIACAAISADGSYIACYGSRGLRIYHLSSADGQIEPIESDTDGYDQLSLGFKLQRVEVERSIQAAVALTLTQTHLIAAHADGSLTALQLTPELATVVGQLAPQESSSSQQRQAGSSAASTSSCTWQAYQPHITLLAASPDGSVIAAAGPSGLWLVTIGGPNALAHSGKLMRTSHDAPVTALAFSADNRQLGATMASGHLAIYDVEACRPSQWCLDHDAAIAACLLRLPGTPLGLSFGPAPESKQLLVYSAGGFCHFDTSQPPDTSFLNHKRRRTKQQAQQRQQQQQPQQDGRGTNGRAILLHDPCLFLGYTAADAAVLLEKPWEEVVASFAPPLYKHRFGT